MQQTVNLRPAAALASSGGASTRGPHRLADAYACERKWALRYIQGWRSIHSNPYALFGSLIHLMIAYYWADRVRNPPPWQETEEEAISNVAAGRQDVIERARACFAAWKQWNEQRDIEPIAIEHEFMATLGELGVAPKGSPLAREVVTCRADLVGRTNGAFFIEDYKSTTKVNREKKLYPLRPGNEWERSFQLMLNQRLSQFSPWPCEIVRVQRISQTPPFDFDDRPIHFAPEVYTVIDFLARDAVLLEERIESNIAIGIKPSPSGIITGRCRWCDYERVCYAPDKATAKARLQEEFRR